MPRRNQRKASLGVGLIRGPLELSRQDENDHPEKARIRIKQRTQILAEIEALLQRRGRPPIVRINGLALIRDPFQPGRQCKSAGRNLVGPVKITALI